MWDYFLAGRNDFLECCCHHEVPRQAAPALLYGEMHLAFLLYVVFTVYVSLNIDIYVALPHSGIIHRLNERLNGFPPLPPFIPPTAHEAAHARISENDIQLTEISLLHRRHRQSGLIAEIDASCPRPPSKHIHPPPQSHFSMKQQLTPNRYS